MDPNHSIDDSLALPGEQFVYVSDALGLSVEAQEKLIELVDGRGLTRAGTGRRLKWPSVASLITDLNEARMHDSHIGPVVADEIRSRLGRLASRDAQNTVMNVLDHPGWKVPLKPS
jgi:hypothetical protein